MKRALDRDLPDWTGAEAGSSSGARVSAAGFTLVELLVAISLIAILLGLLVSSLAGARDSARSAACASNLRQLELANEFFASDNTDRYVPGAAKFLQNRNRWHGTRPAASGPFQAELGPLTQYLGNAGNSTVIRECPCFSETLDALRQRNQGFESGCGGYGYNNAFVGVERLELKPGVWQVPVDAFGQPRDTVGARRSRFMQPARTLVFADAALANERATEKVIEYSFVEPTWWPQSPGLRPDPSIHFRHGKPRVGKGSATGSAGVAWLDGHVSWEVFTSTWTSNLYSSNPSAVGVGWFGTASDNSVFDYK